MGLICRSNGLFIYLSIRSSIYTKKCVCVYLYIYIHISISISLSVSSQLGGWLFICPSILPSDLSLCLSLCPSSYASVCRPYLHAAGFYMHICFVSGVCVPCLGLPLVSTRHWKTTWKWKMRSRFLLLHGTEGSRKRHFFL